MHTIKIKIFPILVMLPLMICSCSKKEEKIHYSEQDKITMSENYNSEITSNQNEKRRNDFLINILSNNGNILETREGTFSNINLNRPSFIKGNEVFNGWNENDILQLIEESSLKDNSISLTPECTDISDLDNVIYNDATFVSSLSDSFVIPIKVGGNINFSILEIELSYDPELFEFDSFTYKDYDVECKCYEKGCIYISFMSTENISADLELCDIKFKNLCNKAKDSMIYYNVKDIAAWNKDYTDYIEVSHEVINGKIVIF